MEDFDEIRKQYIKYYDYIRSIKDKIPRNVYRFAIAGWHYNPKDHRCPHDCWLESLHIEEPSSGRRRERRSINIRVRLLGAYHNGTIELTYKNVSGYTLKKVTGKRANTVTTSNTGHGDWRIDEIRLSTRDNVVHEVLFSNNCRWIIECEDIIYSWKRSKNKGGTKGA
jgi:hypothetical protein